MDQKYKIDRLYLISKNRKEFRSIRFRYLAKSKIINFKSKKQEFIYTNFRGSYFVRDKFEDTNIKGCDFWGTHFKNCIFDNVHISDCVFVGCKFINCRFKDTILEYTTIVNTNLSGLNNVTWGKKTNILYQYPKVYHSLELDEVLNIFKGNPIFRKYKLFHLRKNRYNDLNIYLLQKKFTENKLPALLKKLISSSEDIEFKYITTYKKLEKVLRKIESI